jgi:hypothetical protein
MLELLNRELALPNGYRIWHVSDEDVVQAEVIKSNKGWLLELKLFREGVRGSTARYSTVSEHSAPTFSIALGMVMSAAAGHVVASFTESDGTRRSALSSTKYGGSRRSCDPPPTSRTSRTSTGRRAQPSSSGNQSSRGRSRSTSTSRNGNRHMRR